MNIVQLVRDWLRDPRHGPWLLILDNLDNAYLRSKPAARHKNEKEVDHLSETHNEHGWVLLTTRSRSVALKLVEEKDIITVEPMSPSEAVALLKKKLGPIEGGEDSEALVAALEWMPLAIVQTGAYIAQRAPRYCVRQYLEEFRQSDRKKMSLLDHEGGQLRRKQEAQNSIIITWQISFNHIRQTQLSATNLLSLMSFFDRQRIPEALVRQQASCRANRNGPEKPDEQDGHVIKEAEKKKAWNCKEDDSFEDDVLILKNYSFLSVETNQTFAMHALVQLATRKWLTANGTARPMEAVVHPKPCCRISKWRV